MKGLKASTCLGVLGLALTLAGAAAAAPTQVAQTSAMPKVAAPAKGAPAVGAPAVDPNVSPCDDFFLHACGPWLQQNPIPDDESRWGNFQMLEQRNKDILHDILDKAVASPKPETQKIADFYAACMDEKAVEAKGIAPLKPTLDRIAALNDKTALAPLVAGLHRMGVNALFGFGRMQSFQDATDTIAVADQGGLGLPDRDFYFKDDEKSKDQRAKYVAHIARMFALAGDTVDAAKAKADTVMALETKLAGISMTRTERRDPLKRNNPSSFADFAKLAPGLDWAAYVKDVGAPAFERMNVNNPAFFTGLETVLAGASLDDLKVYLSWHALRSAAPWLSDAFVQENFAFYGKTLSGAKELRPRWKRCVEATDRALGEDLGKYYVEAAFGPEHKQRMLTMVGDILSAFNDQIGKLDWMSKETQAKARAKLTAISNKIGYPDAWKDYSTLTVTRDDLLGNATRAAEFDHLDDLSRIGKKVDRKEWGMTPPTVNAYYSPALNSINFPAGILQPPFFDFQADDAFNYGGIGAVIGHEITHGFDDQGRKFDGQGNLKDWWTEADGKGFEQRAQCLVDQYGGYVADGDVKLNGKLTLGENTADNGGIRIALAALRKHLGAKKMSEKIGGLTAEQRFFYGYANIWCSALRPEAARLRALTDPHSLGRYRVNGVVSNMPEFAKAFNCKPGQAMVRQQQCKVW
ncbi:M13 family metallopeptidase [Oleisolibacter albus]|uniref:M13 family metallopeptidase n=1 Tax=Oleisolibacter albus TaxID=2171757 RepID=UPI000DF332C0|nr:M13 family metallopeptidase [Oleisolibacter albus]